MTRHIVSDTSVTAEAKILYCYYVTFKVEMSPYKSFLLFSIRLDNRVVMAS